MTSFPLLQVTPLNMHVVMQSLCLRATPWTPCTESTFFFEKSPPLFFKEASQRKPTVTVKLSVYSFINAGERLESDAVRVDQPQLLLTKEEPTVQTSNVLLMCF